MIKFIHYNGDHQTQDYKVGYKSFHLGQKRKVVSIKCLEDGSENDTYFTLVVTFEDGSTVEIPRKDMVVYKEKE